MLTGLTRTVKEPSTPGHGWRALALRVIGPGLLIATGAIHLDLYLTGYRSIPTIGWMFLLQVIAAFVLGLAAAGLRSRLVAAAAAGFSLATLGGYLLSVWVGLFGFKEVRTTSGIVAGTIEVAAFAALAALTLAGTPRAATAGGQVTGTSRGSGTAPAAGAGGWSVRAERAGQAIMAMRGMASVAACGVSVIALVLLGVAVAGAGGGASAASGGGLRATTIGGSSVLTSAKGLTLYWFAPDTATTSKCYGSCTAYWPPVTGHPKAGTGVTGKIGTIKRSDGSTQVTYDGHPLYTYVADSAPGQAKGNNLNLNGGLWHEVLASG
jgi:predicted lipoprotein with Yx(FWY)xxD motif